MVDVIITDVLIVDALIISAFIVDAFIVDALMNTIFPFNDEIVETDIVNALIDRASIVDVLIFDELIFKVFIILAVTKSVVISEFTKLEINDSGELSRFVVNVDIVVSDVVIFLTWN
jgi:hypothetical protein